MAKGSFAVAIDAWGVTKHRRPKSYGANRDGRVTGGSTEADGAEFDQAECCQLQPDRRKCRTPCDDGHDEVRYLEFGDDQTVRNSAQSGAGRDP